MLTSDGYYYIKDVNGDPDYSEPIYIDMIYYVYDPAAERTRMLEECINSGGMFMGLTK